MIGLSRVNTVNNMMSFKGVSDISQLQPIFDNPDWYTVMQISENTNQMVDLMPEKFHPILSTFVNGFSILFSFMLANWSGEKLLNTGNDVLNKIRGKFNKNASNVDQKVGVFDSLKNKILSIEFVKNHKNLSTFTTNFLEFAKKATKTSREYLPMGLGCVAAATTFVTQRAEKKAKNNAIAKSATPTQSNKYTINDDAIRDYINAIKVSQNNPYYQ